MNDLFSPSTGIKLSHNGNSFLLDIAEGNLISLNAIYEIAGSPENQSPYDWKRLPQTQELIDVLAKKLNTGKSHIIKTQRGRYNGGTLAHWQLAVAYAKYLSPEFHLAVNEVFKERLEEEVNPELGINRANERAKEKYRRMGKSEEWINKRLRGISDRNFYTETLKAHGVTGQGYAQCTNAICKPIIGATVKEVKEAKGIPANVNLRDTLSAVEIVAIDFAETLAKEKITQNNSQGNRECVKESSRASNAVAKALEHYRS